MKKKDLYELQNAVAQQVYNDTGKVPDVKITIQHWQKLKKHMKRAFQMQITS